MEEITDTHINIDESHRRYIEWKKPDLNEYILWCHLFEVQEQANLSGMIKDRTMAAGLGFGGRKEE